MPKGLPKNGVNKGWFKRGIIPFVVFKKGNVPWNKGKTGYKVKPSQIKNNKIKLAWKMGKFKNAGEKISKKLKDIQRPYSSNEKNPNWKGGRWKEKNGYIVCNIGINKKEREHRIIMGNFLGRKLTKNEFVHHIDGDKSNNDIDNLYLCSNSQHFKIYWQQEQIIYNLYKMGKVIFDRDIGEYKLRI